MASQSQTQTQIKLTVSTSPKSDSGITGDAAASTLFPKGQQCLCSPTTHEGSFRCRFHRSGTFSSSTPPSWMKRTKSMPPNHTSVVSVSPQ
ncbi:hypothetical protein L195_g030538 [Trifolium pratense]|uniref:Uncharacterized protein n=2 Tax=Trifolium pratense TaxID=57577 RepID=A0A2K3L7Y9_TRIPR|nr:hypothetical protein L195_g030538 [Trifolium pratense]CAJ2676199.1 unnamed protein product [Trifolium pratense]